MENNFFVGIVYHGKRTLKTEYREKVVLYTPNNSEYIDLVNDITYTSNTNERDYVEADTLIPTDISEYKTDYQYLLARHYENRKPKRTKRLSFFK